MTKFHSFPKLPASALGYAISFMLLIGLFAFHGFCAKWRKDFEQTIPKGAVHEPTA